MTNFFKIMFFNIMIIGSLITMSSYSWMMMWLGMEINLMAFIPLIYYNKSIYSSEAMMKYFIIQSLASTMLMFSIIILESSFLLTFFYQKSSFLLIMFSALLMKLGLSPFHFWFPEVMEGLSWMSCFLLMTWQKLAPMSMLMMTMNQTSILIVSMILSSLISGILGLNQTSLRKILAYSSINHMAWMLLSMMNMMSIWLIYFFIYSFMNFNLVFLFSKLKLFWINQMNSFLMSKTLKFLLFLNFVSMAGLPPLIGFLPKWLTIFWAINQLMITISIILIIFTLVSIYYYLRILFPLMLMKTSNLKMKIIKWNLNYNFTFFNTMTLFSIPLSNFTFM